MEHWILSPPAQRWINRLGFALMLLSAVLTAAATVSPTHWDLGLITISLRSVRNPVFGLVAGYIMWRTTYNGHGQWLKRRLVWLEGQGKGPGTWAPAVWRQFRDLWKRWGWGERLVLAAVAAQALFALRFWQNYPSYLEFERVALENSYQTAAWSINGQHLPVAECFGRQIREQLPADARILFHGQTAGLRLAYEVYPRRVFMLPQEMRVLAGTWHVQPQIRDISEDRQLAFWQERLPDQTIAERDFIREHRINYVVTFDEYELAKCRVEPVP